MSGCSADSDIVLCVCVAWQATSAQQVVSCAVRWAAVSPLTTDRHEHTLTLIGDVDHNPDSLFVFGGSGDAVTEGSSQLTGSLNVTINVVRCLRGSYGRVGSSCRR